MQSPTIPTGTPPTAPADAASAYALGKVAAFARRLDDHLAGLPEAARHPFLSKLQIQWIARYERFANDVDRGIEPGGGMDAFDYHLCITEINARLARCPA